MFKGRWEFQNEGLAHGGRDPHTGKVAEELARSGLVSHDEEFELYLR